jgi:hypothetical protein
MAQVAASNGGTGTVGFSDIVCRAPCGVVVDGSLGETFTFGDQQIPLTDQFQLLGKKGDVTARVKLGKPVLRFWAWWTLGMGLAGVSLAAFDRFGPSDSRSDTKFTLSAVGGGVGLLAGYLMWSASAPEISLTQGRPR